MANNGHATVMQTQSKSNAIPFGGAYGKAPETREPHSFMERLNEKAAQDITLKRGTLWFIGTVLVLAGVVFSYGSSAIAWVREDETQKVKLSMLEQQITEIRKAQEEQARELRDFRKEMNEQRLAEAKKIGYELKAAETHGGK